MQGPLCMVDHLREGTRTTSEPRENESIKSRRLLTPLHQGEGPLVPGEAPHAVPAPLHTRIVFHMANHERTTRKGDRSQDEAREIDNEQRANREKVTHCDNQLNRRRTGEEAVRKR